jgi:hypothetical protein
MNKVSEIDFGIAMIVLESKSLNPFSEINILKRDGLFYPTIRDYVGDEIFTGDGYSTMQDTLACVGRSYDSAKNRKK